MGREDAPAETATILMSPRHISPWSPLGQSCQRYGEKEGVREKSGAIGMATAAKLVSHKCTALVKVFRGTEPQSLMRQLANWLECLQSMESRMRSVKARGPIASDNLNPIRGFNVAIKIVFLKIEKEKCFLPRLIFGW